MVTTDSVTRGFCAYAAVTLIKLKMYIILHMLVSYFKCICLFGQDSACKCTHGTYTCKKATANVTMGMFSIWASRGLY